MKATSLNPAWAPPISILGVPFDNVTTQQTLALFQEMIESRRPHCVATANVDFVVQASHDIELRRILNDAHLVLCDGMPLVWASHLLGNVLPERVAGADLVPLLLEQAERLGHRVFFLGGQDEVIARALENIRQLHPKLQIAGAMSPPFAPLLEMDHAAICQTVRDAKADILLVSFGCPKQEKWISMNYRAMGVPVCMGVGATIDFLAGAVKRAPLWMQRVGMEWMFRLLQEPKRLLKRYVTDMFVFSVGIAQQIMRLGLRTHRGAGEMHSAEDDAARIVSLPQCFDVASVVKNRGYWDEIICESKSVVLLGRDVHFADSSASAMLTRVAKELRSRGHTLVVAQPSLPLRRALDLMHAESLMEVCGSLTGALAMAESRSKEKAVILSPEEEEAQVISWQGEVTAGNAALIWQQTEDFLATTEEAGCRNLKIDLSSVRFVDSTGIGLMVRTKKRYAARGLSVHFERPSQTVASIIRTLRMEGFLLQSPAPALA